MTKFVAKALAGRMAPGIFTFIVRGKERFPGDPWPHQLPVHQDWYWMHSDECRADPAGSAHALYRDKHIAAGLREPRAAHAAAAPPPVASIYRQPPKARQPDLFTGIHQ